MKPLLLILLLISALSTSVYGAATPLYGQWTNIPAPVPGGSDITGPLLSSVQPYRVGQIMTNFLGVWGDTAGFISFCYPPTDSRFVTNNAAVALIGDGTFSGASADMDNNVGIFAMGINCFRNAVISNSSSVFAAGSGALNGAKIIQSVVLSFVNGGANMIMDNGDEITAFGTSTFTSARITNCSFIHVFGTGGFQNARLTSCSGISAIGHFPGTNLVLNGVNDVILFGNIGTTVPVSNEFIFGRTNNVYQMPGRATIRELVNPGFAVSLTADDQSVSVTNRSYIRLSSDNGAAGNRTFVLSSGTVDGQQLDLEWTGTNAGEMVDDFSATGGGNGRLSATWTPTQYDVIGLRWNGTDWIERYRSTN